MQLHRVRRGLRRRALALAGGVDRGVARLPVLRAKERVYDGSYYRELEPVHGPMYKRLAAALHELLAPSGVVDVGCGTGTLLAFFAARGVEVVGIEGSRHAVAVSQVGERIVRWNLERGVPSLGRFDLCLCIEVAEHLSAQHAARLAAGLSETLLPGNAA